MTILLAEDERDLRSLIKLHLTKEGWTVLEAGDGEEAINLYEANKIDLAILDIMMPRKDGIEVLMEIRSKSSIPVLMLTARGSDADKVLGLGLGADDYMVKPVNPIEIIARVQAHIRRAYNYSQMSGEEDKKLICNGELEMDLDSYTVRKNGKELTLNAKEFKILELLMSNLNKIFTKKQIYESVWGDYYMGDDNTVMVHISHIREKIEDDTKNCKYLKTIRGIGYKMETVE